MDTSTKETKRMDRFVVDMGADEYVLDGGSGSRPGPNTVGTEQIINDSVEMEDLNHKVKDKMMTDDDRVTQEELDQFDV